MPLNEADTRAKRIDPAIRERGWTEENIFREVTAAPIQILGNRARRVGKGRADYTLRIRVPRQTGTVAVALLEAKAEHLPPGHGLEQGKKYAALLNVPFVFSSNGHLFVEWDAFTQKTSAPKPLSAFPMPDELQRRYEAGKGFALTDAKALPLLLPYTGGDGSRRYYQDAAIRATLEAVAQNKCRALLSLATGTGKTRIAVQLLKKLCDAGQVTRALFLCDRDELRTNSLKAFADEFGADAQAVTSANPQRGAKVLIATYQTLGVDGDETDPDAAESFLTRHYPPGFFSHIVIDECHRSAWGKWSEVLTRNADAVQVGLTATPRTFDYGDTPHTFNYGDPPHTVDYAGVPLPEEDAKICNDNERYFGKPVYEYGLAQGIEDGYLAACEIVKRDIFHDGREEAEAETIWERGELGVYSLRNARTGNKVTAEELREYYAAGALERGLILPERTEAFADDFFAALLANGNTPHQKTVIFCQSDEHADRVAAALGNRYADWCKTTGATPADSWAFKCTGASDGNAQLADLRGASGSHFIATTVDLLTTGVDILPLRNVVFFRYVKSPILFFQMVGRGTRLDEPTDKLMFRVYDYTNATRLFGQTFRAKFTPEPQEAQASADPALNSEPQEIVEADGGTVIIGDAGRFVLMTRNGVLTPVPMEEYRAGLVKRLRERATTLEAFRAVWIAPKERRELMDALVGDGYSPRLLQIVSDMTDYDLYDVLSEAAFGTLSRTRRERVDAFGYKHAAWLQSKPGRAGAVLRALAEQFAHSGTEELETQYVFRTDAVKQAGGLDALKAAGDAATLLRDTKERIFAA